MNNTKKRFALWGVGIVLLASVSGTAVIANFPLASQATAASDPQPQAIPVTVATVQPKDVTSWEDFSGRLEAVDRVEVRPRVAGAILSINFREGALVKAGDVLITIDPAPYNAAFSQASADVAAAQAKLDLSKVELDRGQRLSENHTISQSDFDQRQGNYNQMEATLKAAQAELETAQLNLDYTQVRSPINGRVGKREVTAGNLVAAGSTATSLTTIVSVDPIYASFNADEGVVARALAQLPKGGPEAPIDQIPVQIGTITDTGTPIVGKLQLIDNEVQTASGTVRVRAVFANPDGNMLPGQFVRVRMGQPKPESQILISDRAVGTDQDKKFVFTVGADNKVAYQPINIGGTLDGKRIVTNGLKPGDRIVMDGLQHIKPGALVNPTAEQPVASN